MKLYKIKRTLTQLSQPDHQNGMGWTRQGQKQEMSPVMSAEKLGVRQQEILERRENGVEKGVQDSVDD